MIAAAVVAGGVAVSRRLLPPIWRGNGRRTAATYFRSAASATRGRAPSSKPATGREFKLADIVVVDGERVSFFVVHDAAWDEEVQANGGRAFRNTASGALTESTLTISGAREHTGERAYRAELKRVP